MLYRPFTQYKNLQNLLELKLFLESSICDQNINMMWLFKSLQKYFIVGIDSD